MRYIHERSASRAVRRSIDFHGLEAGAQHPVAVAGQLPAVLVELLLDRLARDHAHDEPS
jgi:hypothetical protein